MSNVTASTSSPILLTLEQAELVPPYYKADWYRRKLRAGKIRGSKVGGRWFVEDTAIQELFDKGSNLPKRSDKANSKRGNAA